ncbi:MAG TPA: hypothetical protein VK508_02735 [Cyclobacteriaceae bacterium]|nr:hypothetical protein [Cyclobacteriaceae bacterium]
MKYILTPVMVMLLQAAIAQNTFPSTGTPYIQSGNDRSLILKDNRAGTNWNYIEWQFSTAARDWALGREISSGNFVLYREGVGQVVSVDNTGRMGIGTTEPVANSKLDIRGGSLSIGGHGAADAMIHIKSSSYNPTKRLTQMHHRSPVSLRSILSVQLTQV